MNTIAITGYKRPALFKIQCDQLLKDPEEFNKYNFHIFLDYGFDVEYYKVISWLKQYHRNIRLTIRPKTNYPLPGFYNILDSYKIASEESDEFVILSEEDMIVTNDYLRFNRVCYERFLSKYNKIFCVGHKRRPEVEKFGNIEYLIGDYQLTSPSCISVNMIKNVLLEHLNESLYSNPVSYYQTHFKGSRINPNIHVHQDGFIERCAEKHSLFSIKPDYSRSMHLAIGGQHCQNNQEIKNTPEFYYDLLKKGSTEARKLADKFKEDIVIIPLDNPSWNDLYLDTERNISTASSWHYDTYNNFKDYINEQNL